MPKVIAIANSKGGVSKSTTALNLGVHLARRPDVAAAGGVLLIDVDPNNNLTDALVELDAADLEAVSVRRVFRREISLREAIVHTDLPGLDLSPTTEAQETLAAELSNDPLAGLRFANEIQKLPYAYVIVDAPPSQGYATRAALMAADIVITPVTLNNGAIQGVDTIGRILDETAEAQGKRAQHVVVASDCTPADEAALRKLELPGLAATAIPRTSAIRMAGLLRRSLKEESKADLYYEALAKELAL